MGALPAAADDTVDFARDIQPIFENHCVRCHKPGNAKGEISLATFDDLAANEYVVANNPDASFLLEVVEGKNGESPQMPKEGDPLSKQQVALIRRWIASGATWPKQIVLREPSKADASWWSLKPIAWGRFPNLPESVTFGPRQVGKPAPPVNPIDRFVLAKLHSKGLSPNPPADRRALIRRATYDLTGLPPTPEEVAAFVNDKSTGAYEKLIDRLLDSPRYGERWGRHWLDVVRFGESNGFERNVIIGNLWPFLAGTR